LNDDQPVVGGLAWPDTLFWRQTSTTGVPDSTGRSAYAICSSLNLDFFIASPSVLRGTARSHLTSSLELTTDEGEMSVPSLRPKERP
jgi:hypothetical protein